MLQVSCEMWMHVVKPALLVVCLLLLETRRRPGRMSSLSWECFELYVGCDFHQFMMYAWCGFSGFSRTRRWS
ncbi:hypothetical protein M758_5G125000 [Ceratodon purpureus]|nr:hypothetical protein M758_5G125000 [Ceratodon purpureus]